MSQPRDAQKFEAALRRFDEANSRDPTSKIHSRANCFMPGG